MWFWHNENSDKTITITIIYRINVTFKQGHIKSMDLGLYVLMCKAYGVERVISENALETKINTIIG